MFRNIVSLLSLTLSVAVMLAIVIAVGWFVQEMAGAGVSGQGIPLSAFPRTKLDPDKPIVIDRRNGSSNLLHFALRGW